MPDCNVHTCVTSPPYFGLRSYLPDDHPDKALEIGLEETPDAFIARLVDLFREVRRVLRDDGTCWINIGDSYAGSWGAEGRRETEAAAASWRGSQIANHPKRANRCPPGFKVKDRMMIPARLAIALQADGWWLRDEIVWHKPNPMPSSVTDRTTPAHEMIYMLTKSRRYSFDHEAIKEPAVSDHPSGNGFKRGARLSYGNADGTARGNDEQWNGVGGLRNRRSVWTVTTKPYSGAHFATFPPQLIEPCILAGAPVGGVVLDPFGGSGTTGGVALKHGRKAILCELNPDSIDLMHDRILSVAGHTGDLFARAAE
ncbi:site-specific DNA-methyltransferase [Cereibacter sphaeroides]|nr:site-specific DNA-methyltransferase [Cereibacter sphaeroides]